MAAPFSNPMKTDSNPFSLLRRASSGEYANAAASLAADTVSSRQDRSFNAYAVDSSGESPAGTYNAKKAPSTPPSFILGKSTWPLSFFFRISVSLKICDGVSQCESRTNILSEPLTDCFEQDYRSSHGYVQRRYVSGHGY